MIALLFLQTASDVKSLLSIESVSVIGLMIFFMIYLIWQNQLIKKEVIAKEAKIFAIVQEHRKDLQEGNKDMLTLVNKYHQFVEQLSSLNNNRYTPPNNAYSTPNNAYNEPYNDRDRR